MAILSEEQIDRLKLADVDQKAAIKEFIDTCHLLLRPGTLLYWHSHGHLQSGFIQRVVINYSDMWVQNIRTSKVVCVRFDSIDWDRMISQSKDYEEVKSAVE